MRISDWSSDVCSSDLVALLAKWQRAVNLVGKGTLPDLWRRHMLDSAQLWALLPPGTTNLVDLGSGAGLPGLVLAILGAPDVHLVAADAKKCAFLREAARVTATACTVHTIGTATCRERVCQYVWIPGG